MIKHRTLSGLGLLALGFLFVSTTGAQAAVERRITVSGSCVKRVTPDRGAISAVAEAQDADLRVATREATKIYERLRDDVKKLGLKDLELQTSEYNVQEIREWTKDKYISRGFRARMGLMVTTSEISRIGEVIAVTSRLQVKDVGQLQVFLSAEKLRLEKFACLESATQDARSKAEQMIRSLGAKLGKIETLTELDQSADRISPMMMMASAKSVRSESDMLPPSVEAGNREIQVSVQAAFTLE